MLRRADQPRAVICDRQEAWLRRTGSALVDLRSDASRFSHTRLVQPQISSPCADLQTIPQSHHRAREKGSTYLTVSRTSSPPFSANLLAFSASSFPLPTNKCRLLVLHPSIFINWSNSSTLLLQQLYPLLPS